MLTKTSMLTRSAIAALVFSIGCLPAVATAADLMQPAGRADRPRGSASAPVTLIEYSSPTCPHCVEYRTHIAPAIEEEFVRTGKVRILFRPLARNNVDLVIFMLAESQAEPKDRQIEDAYYSRHDELAKSTNLEETLREIGHSAGIDNAAFDAAVKDEAVFDRLNKLSEQATKDFEVDGTPTFFVNGKKITGAPSLEEIRTAINAALSEH